MSLATSTPSNNARTVVVTARKGVRITMGKDDAPIIAPENMVAGRDRFGQRIRAYVNASTGETTYGSPMTRFTYDDEGRAMAQSVGGSAKPADVIDRVGDLYLTAKTPNTYDDESWTPQGQRIIGARRQGDKTVARRLVIRTEDMGDAPLPHVTPAPARPAKKATRSTTTRGSAARPEATTRYGQVDAYIRSKGYAGAITREMRVLARDAMAFKTQVRDMGRV